MLDGLSEIDMLIALPVTLALASSTREPAGIRTI
jgi:hypothetical protein